MTSLEQCLDKPDYMISMLKEVSDRLDLQQKSNALILSKIAEIDSKLDSIQEIVSRRFKTQSDASSARRERTWST